MAVSTSSAPSPNPGTPQTYLGNKLHSRFQEYKKLRRGIEDRWLDDLRQYRGIYNPEVDARIGPDLSHAFARITRTKVRSITARLVDLVFPAGHNYPWELTPGSNAEVAVDPMALQQFYLQTGMPPTPEVVQQLAMEQALRAAKAMEGEIRDQLDELKFRKLIRQQVHSGNLYGTGLLKGPLVDERTYKAWQRDPASGAWMPAPVTKLRPFLEFVRVWDSYPDPDSVAYRDLTGHFQRHVLTRPALRKLAERSDFDREAILGHIKANPDGNAPFEHFETQLRWMGYESHILHPRTKRYEAAEFWGVVDARDLEETGIEPGDDAPEYWCNVWLLGSDIVKFTVQPVDGLTIPYYAYYFEKDDSSIFGDGIPQVIRSDQDALNASLRAMLDNAAVCAGEMFEVNIDLLEPTEDPNAIHPRRVWRRTGAGVEAQWPAVRPVSSSSHTNEYLMLAQKFEQNIHESTVPSYMHGETDSGVGRTVGGLSMLMGTAQTSLKDQLTILDDDVMEPVITAMYDWNMQFNDREDIRGDYVVSVHGASSLVAREVRSQSLEQFANNTANPLDAPFIDRYALNKERAKALELPDSMVVQPPPQPMTQPTEEPGEPGGPEAP